jgi:hypothetical protein
MVRLARPPTRAKVTVLTAKGVVRAAASARLSRNLRSRDMVSSAAALVRSSPARARRSRRSGGRMQRNEWYLVTTDLPPRRALLSLKVPE